MAFFVRYSDGVYAYRGDKVELYGARGTAAKSSSSTLFDDYGRSISVPSGKTTPVSSNKIIQAVPKTDTQEDAKSGVQKFRVKLLAESGGQSTMDVLCQANGIGKAKRTDREMWRNIIGSPMRQLQNARPMGQILGLYVHKTNFV